MSFETHCEPALAAIYDDLWSHGRRALTSGRPVCEPLPSAGTTRWGISAVLRPWSPALADCAAACRELLGADSVVYGEDNLHVTLRSFEGWRGEVADDDVALRTYRAVMTSVMRDRRAITVRFRGLMASASGVLVQGWPCDEVQALRTTLHDRLLATGLTMTGPEVRRSDLRRTTHATLAMYGATIDRPVEMSAFIERHRDTDFGEQRFETVELVGYRRTARSVALKSHGCFTFGGER